MFKISLSRASKKALGDIDKRIVKRITNALQDFESYPIPVGKYDIKKIEGRKNAYRSRISRYRVVYNVDWENSEVNVTKIEKKDDETYRL